MNKGVVIREIKDILGSYKCLIKLIIKIIKKYKIIEKW